MNLIQKTGLALFLMAMLVFTGMLTKGKYQLSPEGLVISNTYHREAILEAARQQGLFGHEPTSGIAFSSAFKKVLKAAQETQAIRAEKGIPAGVGEWDFKLGDGSFKEYTLDAAKHAYTGPVSSYPGWFLLLTFGLAILGGFLYAIPLFREIPGIRNNHIFHDPLTRGFRGIAAWLGIIAGIYLIVFYILLYWTPQLLTPWIVMVDPISKALNGHEASQWFFYGVLYTVAVLVMGVRMLAKYRHNRYQLIRTGSVMFFQTAFAFLIPEILVRLNYPYYDFKNIWPLNYSFFFDWNLHNLLNSGGLGIFMLVWGIVLIVIAVPVITYFFGKRWYCSWVCGCGGLAETLGDPFRQLSNKKLSAWKVERWLIHGVLVFAVVMTALVLYTYFSGQSQVLFLNSYTVRGVYGFLIGSIFAGVVGTGFYPFMGSRVWCRFGCPLAAYLGLVQRFKSRFRITTNGGQCISCGNCSTYCEMGIDVRAYAQRGQDIVRASCVGCGVCSAVCPRGVLKLENG
ncbi:MAG: 4Fe-4S binding protein [Saprospirales bacterium]|nr:4Fe-4S binding protein [Saprospirales bacterium]